MQLKTSRAIFDYWNHVRGSNPAPSRLDFKPGPVSAILPEIFILQWAGDGDITFRLAGTRVCTLLGKELKDRNFAAIWAPRQSDSMPALVRAVAEHAMPLILEISGFRQDYAPLKFEMMLLPLAGECEPPNRVLGSLAPEHSSTWQLIEAVDLLRLDGLQPVNGRIEPTPHKGSKVREEQKGQITTTIRRLMSLARPAASFSTKQLR